MWDVWLYAHSTNQNLTEHAVIVSNDVFTVCDSIYSPELHLLPRYIDAAIWYVLLQSGRHSRSLYTQCYDNQVSIERNIVPQLRLKLTYLVLQRLDPSLLLLQVKFVQCAADDCNEWYDTHFCRHCCMHNYLLNTCAVLCRLYKKPTATSGHGLLLHYDSSIKSFSRSI